MGISTSNDNERTEPLTLFKGWRILKKKTSASSLMLRKGAAITAIGIFYQYHLLHILPLANLFMIRYMGTR